MLKKIIKSSFLCCMVFWFCQWFFSSALELEFLYSWSSDTFVHNDYELSDEYANSTWIYCYQLEGISSPTQYNFLSVAFAVCRFSECDTSFAPGVLVWDNSVIYQYGASGFNCVVKPVWYNWIRVNGWNNSDWWTISYYRLIEESSSSDCSQDSNYLQCLEDLNTTTASLTTLSWQYSTLSWNYQQCQSDLSSCQAWNDAWYLQCISDLSTCTGSLESQTNLNDSLTSQLQECLAWSGSTGDMSLWCNTYDLFRDNDWDMFSIPIQNNLFLPEWYKAKVEDWVQSITSINSLDYAYSIDDEDFQKVLNGYGIVFIYIFSSALFLLFIYAIRRYFIWLKRSR